MDREKFIKLVSAGTLSSSAMMAVTACATYRYVEARHIGKQLEVSKSSFGEDTFVLTRNPGSNAPIYLGKHTDGTYSALSLECTHRQCTVNPTGKTFTCPCHGSRYDQEGRILEGPARRDLFSFSVTTDADTIYIQLPT
ncbi:MAG: Rieske (2Fe-2S) protein [Balneolales bacterium]